MQLRRLTGEGIDQFRSYLARLRAGAPTAAPTELLNGASSSAPIPVVLGSIQIDQVSFTTKLEMVKYLAEKLSGIPRHVWRYDIGLWAWLSLFFLDQLAPPKVSGHRKLLADELYIPSPHHQRRYRNLLLGPFLIYTLQREKARLLLAKPVHIWSDVEEQLLGVQDIVQIPSALEAADLLYFDAEKGEPKRGITNRKKGGTIRRLREVLQQLDLTFDIYLMSAPELLRLLPSEFDRFKPQSG